MFLVSQIGRLPYLNCACRLPRRQAYASAPGFFLLLGSALRAGGGAGGPEIGSLVPLRSGRSTRARNLMDRLSGDGLELPAAIDRHEAPASHLIARWYTVVLPLRMK